MPTLTVTCPNKKEIGTAKVIKRMERLTRSTTLPSAASTETGFERALLDLKPKGLCARIRDLAGLRGCIALHLLWNIRIIMLLQIAQ